jgi:hypothetical protein
MGDRRSRMEVRVGLKDDAESLQAIRHRREAWDHYALCAPDRLFHSRKDEKPGAG